MLTIELWRRIRVNLVKHFFCGLLVSDIDCVLGGLLRTLFGVFTHPRRVLFRPESAVFEERFVPINGVGFGPFFDFSFVPVHPWVVARRVSAPTIRECFDEGGCIVISGRLDRALCRPMYAEGIISVHKHTVESIPGTAFCDAYACSLPFEGNRDGPLVIDSEKHRWDVEDAGKVQAFVEIALAHRAVAEVYQADVVIPP